ncbi:putative dirigent protein [Helianthus annuus]|uniref:Dirigent protein n=2 Tax=Helianthus annuus TaxID=4232 RepID=A0A251VSH4_HELAN|nr:putative dirigent protein [Helianthus annuus]KAJ0612705.1 putative dirigent protein [Helianthus annuus]KAJ0628074.1 putative dirigent protein [Helianthus annuus]KAJ0793575.1 putative dirigent protein [Helianthus annuus]KAJ0949401.1 putative dirigent protein [Helianthus annuus]
MQMKNIIHTIFHFLIWFNTMANNLISTTFIVVLFSLVLAGKSQTFSTNLPRSTLRLGRQNLTRLHFFFHDVVGGPNATAIRVAAAPITNTSSTGFGAVVMMDNLLTVGPEPNSTGVGRAQGMYASADLNNMSFMMVQNYVFDEERFNGSTLSILGRNPISSPMREFPVVGGTGVFRFARGYAEARTFFFSATNGDAIVEYNVYVLH